VVKFPDIDPVAVQLGPISIYWYGIAYVIGILCGLQYAKYLSKKHHCVFTETLLDSFVTYFIIGMILGGRLGYIVIYDLTRYIFNPMEILNIRNGGMSFHGAVIGIGAVTYIFCVKHKIKIFTLTDLISIVAPIGIFFGRIANFINAELYGRYTDFCLGIIFPTDKTGPRHPSQLYEAFFEGVVLFVIMYFASKKLRHIGYNTGVFLIFYSIFRIFCEFFRDPDSQLGFIIFKISMGQILSIPLLIIGVSLLIGAKCRLKRV
jgi:phosphatidylglycerol:prolipoprotein diacylglycerol transferase